MLDGWKAPLLFYPVVIVERPLEDEESALTNAVETG